MSADAGEAPSRIGRFEIRREIGRGTMGVVYEALDPVLGRTVALKTIALTAAGATGRAAFEQRFLTEARIAARLSHPGIVVIHDVGRDPGSGTLYMAMEHLSGRTLEDLISAGRPLDWRESLRILGRVAVALHHAHAQGVVHRDVKPANVMLLHSGDPKIMDFGIAKLVVEGHATTSEQMLGTPLYMAPEQAHGRAVDARTDIFSLGAIAYSLLTGKRAFQARSIPSILARVLHHDPPPPSTLVAGLPPAVDDLVARATAKSPASRYPTAQAMAEDIEDILAGRTPRHRAGWTPPPVGVRTLVSAGDEELADLDLVRGPAEASSRLRRPGSDPRPRFLAMVLLGGGVGIALAGLLRFQVLPPEEPGPAAAPLWLPSPPPHASEPSPPALPVGAAEAAVPATATEAPGSPAPQPAISVDPAPSPSPEPSPSAESGAEAGAGAVGGTSAAPVPSPSPEPAPVAEGPEPQGPAPSPSPASDSPAPRPMQSEKPSPDPKQKTRLAIHLDPALKAKSFRVYIDGKLLGDEKLDGGAAGKTRTLRFDVPLKVVTLQPGRRQVRVQVRTEDGTRAERLVVTFKAGAARRLDVKAGRSSTALAFVLR